MTYLETNMGFYSRNALMMAAFLPSLTTMQPGCYYEDSGLPDGDPSFPLSLERYTVLGSEDDMFEEAYFGS
jgi:hypothetical protein